MFKLIFLLFSFISISNATLIGTNFNQNDLYILKELDISTSYITDYKLQKTYSKFLEYRKIKYIEHLNEASLFLPKIKNILKKNNIPSSFLFLVMAESNFALDAKSHMKATGLWQFMDQTAKNYGLKNDLYIDERFDIVKSTVAATKYLKYLHKTFGKWYLAAIAYNCGEGRVIEAITRATIDMYVDKNGNNETISEYRKVIRDYQHKRVKFNNLYQVYKEVKKWDLKPDIDELLIVQENLDRQYLPDESQEYIRKIISYAMMSNRDFILDDSHLLNLGVSSSIATIKVKGGTHLKNIAKSIDLDYEELYSLNRHIKQYIVPPYAKEYDIYIPYGKLAKFNINKNSIEDTKFAIHIVKPGESLGFIGRKYDINYKIIKEFNSLKSNLISINQQLVIPIASEKLPKPDINYVVKSGDTLLKIAKDYSIDLNKLMKDNQLKTSFIRVGDTIVIREK